MHELFIDSMKQNKNSYIPDAYMRSRQRRTLLRLTASEASKSQVDTMEKERATTKVIMKIYE